PEADYIIAKIIAMAFRLSAYLVCCIALAAQISSSAARVVEVGEEFIGRDASQAFLVKFYAPWCGHCRNMEPAYEEVSDRLAGSPVTVARIDATVHQAAAAHFRVRGFPTLIYVKGDTRHEFRGERTADEIVKFVNRVSGDPVKVIASPGKFNEVFATSVKDPFFLFIGSEESKEFAVFNGIAGQMRTDSSFYRADAQLLANLGFDLAAKRLDRGHGGDIAEPCVLAFKDNGFVLFRGQFDNDSLGVWMTNERFHIYPKLGDFLFYSFYPSTKLLVAIVTNESDPEERRFVQLGRALAFSMDLELANVQFGWAGSAKAASDMAMTSLPTPNVMLLNPNSTRYYLRPDYHLPISVRDETVGSLKRLVLQGLNGELPAYGGGGLIEGLKRTVYDFATGLAGFVLSHPGLALVVIGAPVAVVSILCYAICCMDTTDDVAEGEVEGDAYLDDEGEDEVDEANSAAIEGEDEGEGKKDQ
ncbi:hypothetical protein BOX15_Mlig025829g3, partial [Macrostomum lignano]